MTSNVETKRTVLSLKFPREQDIVPGVMKTRRTAEQSSRFAAADAFFKKPEGSAVLAAPKAKLARTVNSISSKAKTFFDNK